MRETRALDLPTINFATTILEFLAWNVRPAVPQRRGARNFALIVVHGRPVFWRRALFWGVAHIRRA